MSAAFYAIAGTIVGALGTALIDIMRSKRDQRGRGREALRTVTSDFTTQIARVRRYAMIISSEPEEYDNLRPRIEADFAEARACYERLLITAESLAIQTAARHVLHFTYWMTYLVRGNRDGFHEAHTSMLNWSLKLYVEVRRELGLRNPDIIFEDPPEGLPKPWRNHSGGESGVS